MSGMVLHTPLTTLKPIAAGIWVVDGPIMQMAALGMHAPFPTA